MYQYHGCQYMQMIRLHQQFQAVNAHTIHEGPFSPDTGVSWGKNTEFMAW